MSYRLNKNEATETERCDFIVLHNHNNGRRIEETDEYLYALEPNEIMQDGEPVINPEWDSIELANAKADKIALNDRLRDETLYGGVTYQNILFDSDTDQKVNLLATVSAMGDEDTILWFGMDNQGLLCTKADLIAIGGLITELHSFCWQNNAYIKEQIAEAETLEELEAIEISYDQEGV